MKRLEQFSAESLDQTDGETTIDTKIEVDLISGGVGFDDEPAGDFDGNIFTARRFYEFFILYH